jgi:hypothetical protein
LTESEVAPETDHARLLALPAVIVEGLAVKEEIVGRAVPATVSVRLRVTDPAEFDAVRVKTVLLVGLTGVEVRPVTVPTP